MRLIDSRRLTGPSLDLESPGAIAEVAFDPADDPQALADAWRDRLVRAAAALGWTPTYALRIYPARDGAALSFTAPLDALYLATDVNDWALGLVPGDLDAQLPAWRRAREREAVPGLSELLSGAGARGLPLLLDDDSLSIGVGRGSRTWPRAWPPALADVPWDTLCAAPIALITGTNGKTTTARMLARIARCAGHVPGNTSTDGLAIDEQLVDPGDWTGPGAARTVLRDPRVTLAVLEVARGGILRRGLGVAPVDAACITNVSADHLGEHGIDDLAGMARVKAVVARAVRPAGQIVLGADSPPLLDLPTDHFPAPVTWFSLDPAHPRLLRHRAAGGRVYFLSREGLLTRGRPAAPDEPLLPAAELPSAFGGAATHNVANALAAAALADALGLPDASVLAGLRSFASNPGRAHHLTVAGVHVFLDFAHNPDGLRSIAPLLAHLRGERRLLVSIGVAGDRRDDDIRAVARAVGDLHPDLVLTRDLDHYLRGRRPGEVPALLEAALQARGVACERAAGEVQALSRGLEWARPGDLVAILVHVDRDEVWSELQRRGVDPPAGVARTEL